MRLHPVCSQLSLFIGIVTLLCAGQVAAQDTRSISEPVMPATCVTLAAAYTSPESISATDDTARIQQAMDSCPGGQTVQLSSTGQKTAFVSGPLIMRGGVSLAIAGGTTLFASSDPRAYDTGQHSCGTNGDNNKGCRPFISVEAGHGGSIVGPGVIDGQGGQLMTGKPETWWQLSRRAQKEHLNQNVPHLIVIDSAQEFSLYKITLRNSPKFHVVLRRVDGFTAWSVNIDTPSTARNTDGIDPGSSRNVTIAYSFIRAGDDNVAIKSGPEGATENVSIIHNHFYSGHGMSIGSNTDGGVHHVLVDDLTMDGTVSGLRIKSDVSRGGLVSDIHYRNICLRNVGAPLDLDSAYDTHVRGTKFPVYQDLFFEHVHSVTPGRIILRGLDEAHLLSARFDDVVIDGTSSTDAVFARIQIGPGAVKPIPSGSNVQVDGSAGEGAGIRCEGRFIPFPELP